MTRLLASLSYSTTPMLKRLTLTLSALACIIAPNTFSQELDSLKSATERWIEVRNRLSREQAEWKTEKELLKSTIKTLQATRDSISGRVERLELEGAELASETEVANKQLEAFTATETLTQQQVSRMEARILEISERLPRPLLDKVAPLLRKIPTSDTHSLSTADRLQNAVSIATLIDEFNNNLTLAHTIRTMENGEALEVRVLYWGLASGYAASSDGSKAWILQPQVNGWSWQPIVEEAESIQNLFLVYDKMVDPIMVGIPFTFKEDGASN